MNWKPVIDQQDREQHDRPVGEPDAEDDPLEAEHGDQRRARAPPTSRPSRPKTWIGRVEKSERNLTVIRSSTTRSGARQAVLRAPDACAAGGSPRSSVDARPEVAGDRREEAMHLAVELEPRRDLAPVRLDAAAVVVELHVGRQRDDPVRDPRRQDARHEVVLAVALRQPDTTS